jgi:hypothetical protein
MTYALLLVVLVLLHMLEQPSECTHTMTTWRMSTPTGTALCLTLL